jgi:chromosome segregation ATPase
MRTGVTDARKSPAREGTNSRGGSPRSSYGSFKSTQFEGNDKVVHYLKKELGSLKQNSKGLGEMMTRLSNTEHKYTIVLKEKNRDEEIHRAKQNEQEIEISRLAEEIKLIKERHLSKETEISELRSAYFKLTQTVGGKEEEIFQSNRELDSIYAEYRRLDEEHQRQQGQKGNILQEAKSSEENAELIQENIKNYKEQISKQKRVSKELKVHVADLKAKITELKNELYNSEKELKNLGLEQVNKENYQRRLIDKANLVESEISMIESEKENLKDLYASKEDTLKHLIEIRAEHNRRETVLTREKLQVDSQVDETLKELTTKKSELLKQENEKVSSETELKSLESFYERLRAENGKLCGVLRQLGDTDEKAVKSLKRAEVIDNVVFEATKELTSLTKAYRDN